MARFLGYVLGGLFGVAAAMSSAKADVFPFVVFNQVGATASGQVDVTGVGGPPPTLVDFVITNTSPASLTNSITDIYFRNTFNSLLTAVAIQTETGVDFGNGASPPSLPGGNDLDPDWENASFSFSAFDSVSPPTANGIQVGGDSLRLRGTLASGVTLAQIFNAVRNGGIGVHIQSGCFAGNDGSCSAVTTPLPAAAWLFISAIGGLFGWRRWQGRRDAEAVPA